jgi:hypothetical protein
MQRDYGGCGDDREVEASNKPLLIKWLEVISWNQHFVILARVRRQEYAGVIILRLRRDDRRGALSGSHLDEGDEEQHR